MATRTLHSIGREACPLLVVDDLGPEPTLVADIAAALGPFPAARGNSYPGLRRTIRPDDGPAVGYARDLLRGLVPAINEGFGVDGFDLLIASFSLVTARPDALAPIQRAPHFDSADPLILAVLHYVGGAEGSGTGFYRQRSTGIERVTGRNNAAFMAAAQAEASGWHGYIGGSTPSFEQIGAVDAVPGRVIVYQGSLLHSGHIPADMSFSDDPRVGRLTGNFFVRGRPRAAARAG
ncbi:DUF6445 family protein [Sphingomonas bacterium]|uniref:DUF6445 family protein n=1 Tax=Sphingomonas bacterium TaxID=1895847 RepID=UPI0015759E75|nr:DUF6445 family protein [Sphingomonas bacterium]